MAISTVQMYKDSQGGVHKTHRRAEEADERYVQRKIKEDLFKRIAYYYESLHRGGSPFGGHGGLSIAAHHIIERLYEDRWISPDAVGCARGEERY